jgi:hypothetical protein
VPTPTDDERYVGVMVMRTQLAALPAVLLLAACGAPIPTTTFPTGQASGQGASSADGVWRTDGYGWVIQVSGGHARTYETTSLSCLPEHDLPQVNWTGTDGGTAFGKHDSTDETIRRTSADRGELRLLGTAADIDLTAIPSVPAACLQPTANDPQTNFDVFWANFRDNYNSTVRKHVDWNALRSTYRPQVTATTTPDQLYQILVNMVQPLGDAHIQIDRDHGDSYEGYRPGTRYTDGAGGVDDDDAIKSIDQHLTQDLHATDLRKWGGGALAYADLPDGRGYLRLTDFEDWDTKPDNYLGRQALLDQVLDQVFSADHVKTWRGLVIDVSYNDGGDDQLGLSLAGRMTDTPYTAYTKLARTDPNDPTKYGRARVVTVQPTPGRPHYTGPVRLITSDVTISAGETFAEALMARTPPATRYGMTTQGVFADNMDRKLPNGWSITVGNEDYLAPDGHNYEDTGIPPTVNVPVFTPEQLAAHQDPALDMTGDTR